MIVAPVPVGLAIVRLQLAVISVIPMVVILPAGVGFAFARTPDVIVRVGAIIITRMNGTSGNHYRDKQHAERCDFP